MWGKKKGKGKGQAAPQRESEGRSQGKDSAEHSSVLQVHPFGVVVSTDWSVTGQGVFSHCSWSWHHPPGFAAFLSLELEHH